MEHQEPKKSLAELEKIYARNKNLQQKPDLNFDTLKISKDELNTKPAQPKLELNTNSETGTYIGDPSLKKDEFIEIKTFLPKFAETMISSRYESPLKDLKVSTNRWKMFTLLLGVFSFAYFSLHLWATLTLSNLQNMSVASRAILQVSNVILQMQDILFYNYTMNVILDCWALLIYGIMMIALIRSSSGKIESYMEEKGRFEKALSLFIVLIVVLFGLSEILGTVFVLYMTETQVQTRDMAVIISFHLIKLLYLLLNVVAFKKYKTKKFIYEDLLLEALGPSDSGEEKSEEEHRDNIPYNNYPMYM